MEYYVSKDYKPRYVIPFDDVDGNHWKVSIQEPNFVGTETTLTGGEFPVRWEGEGDESQEEVVLGSTGRLSIVCLAGQESLFTVGNILPREINDRRVQVLRDMGNGNWYPYWQGFIKPETLSQDWDAAPYEIELPIVSAVAAMEYFLMPLPNQPHENMNAYDELFFGVTNIAGLLRAIIAASGCEFRNIITNWSWYYDMTGEVKMIPRPGFPDQYYEMHWTQGTASSLFFYDVEDGVMQPKTFKDVLENICYPYGKIHEYGKDFAVMMRTMDDAATVSQLFYMPVWEDYETGEFSDEVRFITYTDVPLYKILMSDVLPAGADNAISNISAPSLVSFRNDVEKKKEIFELTDKFIKPTLPLGDTWAGKPIISSNDAFNGMTRYLYCIDKQYVDLTFADNWHFDNDMAFCRVIEAKGESNETVNYDITAPLAFCFNRQTSAVNTKFTPKIGFLTRPTRNRIKLTLKCWYFGEEDSINGTYMSGPANAKISFLVKDETASKYLNYSSGSWVWEDTTNGNDVSDMTFENGECTLMFNEFRVYNEQGVTTDNSLHKLEFTFAGYSNIGSVGTYGQLYMTFKLEYVKNATIYEDVIMGEFGGAVLNNGNNQTLGGNGEKLEINFETMAGKKQTIDGSMMLPANSFCNSKEFIDLEQREKIEIEAAQFERYTQGIKNFDFALNYIVVKDGQKVFIPVAVGMNPRMNTLKLTLVSTNVTS